MIGSFPDLPLWCIVQADGDRLFQTSRGRVPVQYWSASGSPSLTQRSLHRALRIAKARQIIVTVAESHRHWWSSPLWCVPPQRRIVDESSGRLSVTLAAAIALIERESKGDALMVLQPADTFDCSETAFATCVTRAVRALQRLPHHIVIFTIDAYARDASQDYLLLGPEDGLPGRAAVRFIKRPQPIVAERLIETGARLSTGIYVARLSSLTSVLTQCWPELMTGVRGLGRTATGEIATPARMAGSQFSRPWRHTWAQRPLPRLRAIALDDETCSSIHGTNETVPLNTRAPGSPADLRDVPSGRTAALFDPTFRD